MPTRSNIDTISIQNFKFFPQLTVPIKIDGKNVLLFGENGSGKSTIFWALYTLLEASNKEDDDQIKKYFDSDPDAKESLRNINIIPGSAAWADPFINIKLKDTTEYNVSFTDTSTRGRLELQQNNYASEFLNYKLLFRIHDFKHSEEIDLFKLFEKDVLPFVKFTPVNYWHTFPNGTIANLNTENAKQILDFVNNGPQKNIPNLQGRMRYPYKYESQQTDYRNIINSFKRNLNELLTYINTEGNPILKDKLKQDFEFNLSLRTKEDLYITAQSFYPPEYSIKLTIPKYEGKENVVVKPHTFLNEARLNALALSIHLAILKKRIEDAKLRIAIFDDLIISLDMSNRDKITKIIFEDYCWYVDDSEPDPTKKDKNYQTFIFTHDRSYFTWVKHEIDNLPEDRKNNWKVIEMYVQDKDRTNPNDYEKPILFDSVTELAIAYRHFNNYDYPSAANYLRKHVEKLLEWFPDYCWRDKEKIEKSNSKQDLYNILVNSINLLTRANLDCQLYKDLKKFVKILLNPLSHADVGVDRYKEEIRELFDLCSKINDLQIKINRIEMSIAGDKIELAIFNPSDNLTYVGEYELKENVYIFQTPVKNIATAFKAKLIGCYTVDPGAIRSSYYPLTLNFEDMAANYKNFCNRHNLPKIVQWWKLLFKLNGERLFS